LALGPFEYDKSGFGMVIVLNIWVMDMPLVCFIKSIRYSDFRDHFLNFSTGIMQVSAVLDILRARKFTGKAPFQFLRQMEEIKNCTAR
jgi:hypothetical protein